MEHDGEHQDETRSPELPGHIGENVQAIARLHAAHERRATWAERALETVMAFLGRPAFAGILTFFVAGWIGSDLWLARSGRAFDPAPFQMLAIIFSLLAVYMTAVVLIVQRRAQRMALHREQLMLQLALLADQKTAKLIALIEELRRDDPLVRSRADRQAEELTRPADPEVVLQAIRESSAVPSDDATA